MLETSDVPGGVVNLLTGSHAELAPHLASHADIDAVWSFSSTPLAAVIEAGSVSNLKRTVIAPDVLPPAAMLRAATEVKNIWVPYGE